jgi:SAM-dependent methyltransferase
MLAAQLIRGLLSYVPGIARVAKGGTGGTVCARYCYSVWLRHLVRLHQAGCSTPDVVAELGPGDSLGIGLAALLSGATKYISLDVVAHANVARNLAILDALVCLFEKAAPIPAGDEFPEIRPPLQDYSFPSRLLSPGRLKVLLEGTRVEAIRASLRQGSAAAGMVQYRAPWTDQQVIERETVDMIFSQAVLEHVDSVAQVYCAMHTWLKPGGIMSHQIDFRSHGTAREWNGHWAHSDLLWKLIRGRRPYLLNREPHSRHLRLIQDAGFEIICDLPSCSHSPLTLDDLAPRFRALEPSDRTTSGAFIQALKPRTPAPRGSRITRPSTGTATQTL